MKRKHTIVCNKCKQTNLLRCDDKIREDDRLPVNYMKSDKALAWQCKLWCKNTMVLNCNPEFHPDHLAADGLATSLSFLRKEKRKK